MASSATAKFWQLNLAAMGACSPRKVLTFSISKVPSVTIFREILVGEYAIGNVWECMMIVQMISFTFKFDYCVSSDLGGRGANLWFGLSNSEIKVLEYDNLFSLLEKIVHIS